MATDVLMSQSGVGFADIFQLLTGNRPYRWQEKLFHSFLSAFYPSSINLPTGSGKTSIMAIWLAALAHQASLSPPDVAIPRRLVWVVDRRVVVDQATSEAEQLAERVNKSNESLLLRNLRDVLAPLSSHTPEGDVLAISTLRGEKEDNRTWSRDPSRPAIIVGTVDMIGSRLLFSGYGDGPYWAAQHAGLLGHDALVVNDEAHLTPAFADLLRKLEDVQPEHLKPFRTIRLSATHASGGCWPESLEQDHEEPRFRKNFETRKGLDIRALPAAKFEGTVLELAMGAETGRTLIFFREPEKVRKFADTLAKKGAGRNRIRMLTGTMRGFERDQLTESEVFKAFAARERPAESYWLVATSAAEVGVNISADRLITDLDTLDHLLQRFGRLNRFGETDGVAHLLTVEAEGKAREKDARRGAALAFLRSLPQREDGFYDISPSALFGLDLPETALSEAPLEAPLHNWHIDVWSQTSLGTHPVRPAVGPWLHGKQENYPETYVAWREDVPFLTRDEIDPGDREEVLRKYRLLAHEQLREPTSRLLEKLEELAAKANVDTKFLLRKRDGGVDVHDTGEFRKIENEAKRKMIVAEIAYCQILLPPGCGRLDNGMLTPEWGEPGDDAAVGQSTGAPYDVSSDERYAKRAAFRRTLQEDGTWRAQRLGGIPIYDSDFRTLADPKPDLRGFASDHGWRFLLGAPLSPPDDDTEAKASDLLYFGEAGRNRPAGTDPYWLDDHLAHVAEHAEALAERLGMPELASAYKSAGELHDLGKSEPIWQKAAGNYGDSYKGAAVAKSIKPMRGRELNGFRHELVSLRRAEERLRDEPSELREFILHLIASHHGRSRPHFETKAYDRKHLAASQETAMASARRFARLQERFGPWGLAYLEAIFKAADGLASGEWEDPNHA
ncbi:MAG: type I-U CRISPR-associated helicase/endonuclease Cas3 [Acidobacteriaceae bacterium]